MMTQLWCHVRLCWVSFILHVLLASSPSHVARLHAFLTVLPGLCSQCATLHVGVYSCFAPNLTCRCNSHFFLGLFLHTLHTKKNHCNFERIKFRLLCRIKWRTVLKSVVRVVLFFRHGARTFKWRLKTTAVSGRAQQHITQACFVLHLFVVLTSFLSLWHPVQELWGPRLNNSNTLPTKLWENLMLQNKHLAVSYDWWSSPVQSYLKRLSFINCSCWLFLTFVFFKFVCLRICLLWKIWDYTLGHAQYLDLSFFWIKYWDVILGTDNPSFNGFFHCITVCEQEGTLKCSIV